MTISSALSSALSGLLANQRQADVSAQNIANATTPGYSRREVEVDPLVAGGRGQGVRVTAVRRQVDLLLIRDTRLEQARLEFATANADAYTRVADAVGNSDSINSLPKLLERTEEAFRALETTPESAVRQQDTLRAVQQLTRGFSELSDEFVKMRSDTDAAIQREVSVLNDSLQQLARVNRELTLRANRGADTGDLEDQRDQLIDEVARRIPVRVVRGNDDTSFTLMTVEGVPLIDLSAATVEFDNRAIVSATELYDPNGLAAPGYSHALSGLSVNGRDIAPGSGDAQSIDDGRIAGLFRVRDEILVQAQQRLDSVAYALAERFQDTSVDISLAPGDAGLFTDRGLQLDTTDPAAVVGFAARIAVNDAVNPAAGGDFSRLRDGIAAVTPGVPGDPGQVSRFIGAFVDPTGFTGGSDLSDNSIAAGAREFTQLVHQARTASTRDATAQEVSFQAITDLRLSTAGVSIDVELQKLALFERSYAANSQVIQAASRMLDELLAIAR
mgnify:CR=1 FL=1